LESLKTKNRWRGNTSGSLIIWLTVTKLRH
jgi:hypothetical protein